MIEWSVSQVNGLRCEFELGQCHSLVEREYLDADLAQRRYVCISA